MSHCLEKKREHVPSIDKLIKIPVKILLEMTMSKLVDILNGRNMVARVLKYNQCEITTPFNGFFILCTTDFQSNVCVRYKWEECEFNHTIFNAKYEKESKNLIVSQILRSVESGMEERVFGSFLEDCRQQFVDQSNTRDELQLHIAYAINKGRNIDRLKYYKACYLGKEALWLVQLSKSQLSKSKLSKSKLFEEINVNMMG